MHRIVSVVIFCTLVFSGASALAASPRSFSVEVVGHGPPVILIPGLSCGADVWKTTIARYAGDHELHVLTLAGFAGRPSIAGPLLPTVRDELATYIRQHHLAKPIVVGHSLGGFLALWLAIASPDLLGGVMVVDAVPFLPALFDPTATAESARPQAEKMRQALSHATPEAFAAQTRSSLAAMITNTRDIAAVATSSTLSDPSAVATAMFELMTTDLRPHLDAIHVPTLVLAAGATGAPAEIRKQYSASYAGLVGMRMVVAESARHFIMLDDPGFFFAQLDQALRQGPR